MKIIEIKALENGAHRNQTGNFKTIPDGYAVIPDDMTIPSTFPFVNIEVAEETRYKEVKPLKDVVKTREVNALDENGEPIVDDNENPVKTIKKYTVKEMVTEQIPYTAMVVTSMTEGVMPEPEPIPEAEPTTDEILNTLLGVE
jgi:hypothetical protein